MTYCFFSSSIFSNSRLTIVAPRAVSSTPAKPSFLSASVSVPMLAPSKYAMKEGATDAMTGADASASMASTISVSSTVSLAFCGQTT